MKKTILTLIVCFACGLAYAEQVTPVLTGYCELGWDSYPKIRFLYIDNSENQQVSIDIYNVEDFTVDKQIKFSIPETNSRIFCQMVLDQFVMVETYDTTLTYNDNNKASLKLYDAEGVLIYDFGKADAFSTGFGWDDAESYQIASNKILFSVHRDNYSVQEYYTLTFEPSESGTQNVQVEKKAAFPCPARGEVNIPTRGQQGDLRVLNLNGQVLDAQRIQEGDYQRVNTESYPAGTYIYQAGNETGKFMVE